MAAIAGWLSAARRCGSGCPRDRGRRSSEPRTAARSKQMTELVSRCPRGPRSGADVGREVLAGEGGAGGDELGGCALEDDPAAVVAGAGTEGDDPVGGGQARRGGLGGGA